MAGAVPTPDAPKSWLANISTHPALLVDPNAVLQRYGKAVRCYLIALVGRDDAEEAAQEIALAVVSGKFAKWDPDKSRFRDYLKAAVRHAAWGARRRLSTHAVHLADPAALADLASRQGEDDGVWLDAWRDELIKAALNRLSEYQAKNPGNVFYTLVRLRIDHPDLKSDDLAVRLSHAAGRSYTPENARQQKVRALRKFAELLVEEVCATLNQPTPEGVEEELCSLGLMSWVRPYLAPDWRSSGNLAREEE
jgi:hypothetical protein